MTCPERLRLAAALVHVVPGAELRLTGAFGESVVIGPHPDADLTARHFRAVLLSPFTGANVDVVSRIGAVEFAGAVEDVGGGVLRTRTVCGLERRWIATTLARGPVVELLDDVRPPDLPEEAIRPRVVPDAELGVTVVALTAHHRRLQSMLDQVAVAVAARSMAEELVRACDAHDLLSTPKDGDA